MNNNYLVLLLIEKILTNSLNFIIKKLKPWIYICSIKQGGQKMEYVLNTYGLTKTYKKTKAVNNVSMNVPKGAIYGFVGRNGSGKTTLIRMITGLINPTEGRYTLYNAGEKSAIEKARRRIAAVVETPSIYLEMTATKNLILQCKVLGICESVVSKTLAVVGLENAKDKKARNFSLGMKQRLGIAIALIGNPDFIILDEPTNGLDPEGIVEIRELLLKLNRENNITILVSSHILSELSKIATHYGFINQGTLIKECSANTLNDLCRKRKKVTVDSTKDLPTVLDKFPNITDYKILSQTQVDIYGEINLSEFVEQLKIANIALVKINEQDEDLESFYINLIGGKNQ